MIKAREAGWTTYESIRLLKNYEIVSDTTWLASNTPYWLDGSMTVSMLPCPTGTSCTQSISYWQQVITVNGSVDILVLSSQANLRPVIKIHKKFVSGGMSVSNNSEEDKTDDKVVTEIQECINTGKIEAECTEEVSSPKEDKLCPNESTVNIQTCINNGSTENECIKKLCPIKDEIENPKTGLNISIISIVGLLLISMSIYIVSKRKNYFKKN